MAKFVQSCSVVSDVMGKSLQISVWQVELKREGRTRKNERKKGSNIYQQWLQSSDADAKKWKIWW